MLKAKDTIQDKIRRVKLQLGDDYGDEGMMEEAIFKAGIKEVVESIEEAYFRGRRDGMMMKEHQSEFNPPAGKVCEGCPHRFEEGEL